MKKELTIGELFSLALDWFKANFSTIFPFALFLYFIAYVFETLLKSSSTSGTSILYFLVSIYVIAIYKLQTEGHPVTLKNLFHKLDDTNPLNSLKTNLIKAIWPTTVLYSLFTFL